MTVLQKLDQVEEILKHQPGRHPQQRHAGGRGGGGGDGGLASVGDNPKVKKYFKDGPEQSESAASKWAPATSNVTYTTHLDARGKRGDVQRIVVNQSKDDGKFYAQVQGGKLASLNTWGKSDFKNWHNTADGAISEAVSQAEDRKFLTPVN